MESKVLTREDYKALTHIVRFNAFKLPDEKLQTVWHQLDAYDLAHRQTIEAQKQQTKAWRLAFEGLERQHKALADQIPAEMIQADPVLLERVTTAAAMEEIGRQQIAELQSANEKQAQRIKELEPLYADSCSALNEHMEIHADVVNKLKESEAEVARLNKLMDPIDQQCCEEQAKWKAEAQWAAGCLEVMNCYVSSKIVERAQRILKGEL